MSTAPDAAPPRRTAGRWALGAVLALPVLANAPAIFGLVKYAPELRVSGLDQMSLPGFKGYVPGRPFIDPNVGFISQTLGHVAALSWLHGHIPWWNPLEGVGMPLGASLQSAAFLPVTLLQALPSGSLWFHLALELIAGLSCYALLRRLGRTPFAAAAGSIAFEMCGTFAWLTNSAMNPLAFLPLCLLGVELVVDSSLARRRGGWVLLALGVWLSVVAGFPEVAALDGVLVACWFVVRLAQHRQAAPGIARRAALGIGAGVLLAAPVLNAFGRYLGVAQIAGHSRDLAASTLPLTSVAQYVSPYVFGGIFESTVPAVTHSWDAIGGYTGVTLVVLALAALFGRTERPLRWMLAAFAVLFLGSSVGVPGLHLVVEHLPGLTHVSLVRYGIAPALFCLCVLAAFALDDARAAGTRQLLVRVAPGIALVVAMLGVGLGSSSAGTAFARAHLGIRFWAILAVFAGTVGVILVAAALGSSGRTSWRWRWLDRRRSGDGASRGALATVLLGLLLCTESTVLFAIPILEWPTASHLNLAPVTYLQQHLGSARFYAIDQLAPDYGSYYGIASLDATDDPIPLRWKDFVHSSLNGNVAPGIFGAGGPLVASGETPTEAFVANLPSYEAAAVRYVVVTTSDDLPSLFQPRTGSGVATLDGARVMTVALRAPSFVPGASISGFRVPLADRAAPHIAVSACSGGGCVADRAATVTASTLDVELDRPLVLGTSLVVRLTTAAGEQVPLLTVPSTPASPVTVRAGGLVLRDRATRLRLRYLAATLPSLVATSGGTEIYELAAAAPIASAPGCSVTDPSPTRFALDCTGPSELTYRELSFPGWRATVDGVARRISTVDGVFQLVDVPAGRSVVTFAYEPPGAWLAWLAMGLGVVMIAVSLVRRRWPADGRGGSPGEPLDLPKERTNQMDE